MLSSCQQKHSPPLDGVALRGRFTCRDEESMIILGSIGRSVGWLVGNNNATETAKAPPFIPTQGASTQRRTRMHQLP